ncbi:hypothetical protein REPUB_Repub16aG0113900 [Reevesia pubescens]
MAPVPRDSLLRADHIYSACNGGLYYHHGIYVGKAKVTNPNNGEQKLINDAVIHFLGFDKKSSSKPQCKRCFHMSRIHGIVITCLDCFLDANAIYVYEYNVSYLTFTFSSSGSCSTSPSYSPDQVIQTAFHLLENKSFGEYSFVFNNCEHFATYCKTGQKMCNQVLYGTGLPGTIAYNVARGIIWGS